MMTQEGYQPYQYRGLFRAATVPPCLVSLEDLQRLFTELNTKTAEALERHLATLIQPPEMQPEQFSALKEEARRVGTLTVTIQGADGEQIIGTSDDVLKANLPDSIDWISFDSAASLKVYNVTPLNRFTVRLDFTEPPSFDSYNPWEQPTPNNSQLEVIGSDHTWATAVYESTLSFFRKRGRRRQWLHSQQAFNAANWLVGFPAALWLIYRLDSGATGLAGMHPALLGALYVYVFLLVLLVFRSLIWAIRWMFPVIEFEGARSNVARAAVGTVVGSLVLALLYDVLRAFLWLNCMCS